MKNAMVNLWNTKDSETFEIKGIFIWKSKKRNKVYLCIKYLYEDCLNTYRMEMPKHTDINECGGSDDLINKLQFALQFIRLDDLIQDFFNKKAE